MADVDAYVTGVVLGVLERNGLRLLGGDAHAADSARTRIVELEAKLALTADQFADDIITTEQVKRINHRHRPQLAAERSRLAAAQPASELAAFAGPGVREAWDAADVETRKAIIRLLGMRMTTLRVGRATAGSTTTPRRGSSGRTPTDPPRKGIPRNLAGRGRCTGPWSVRSSEVTRSRAAQSRMEIKRPCLRHGR